MRRAREPAVARQRHRQSVRSGTALLEILEASSGLVDLGRRHVHQPRVLVIVVFPVEEQPPAVLLEEDGLLGPGAAQELDALLANHTVGLGVERELQERSAALQDEAPHLDQEPVVHVE